LQTGIAEGKAEIQNARQRETVISTFQFQLSTFLPDARQRQAVISTFNFPRFSVLAFTPHIPPLPNPCKFL
jgi:hypothetical protein